MTIRKLLFALLLGLGAAAQAQTHGAADAQKLLDRAVAYLETKGPEAALAAYNDPKGPFVADELYVFAFDLNGTYRASGANPKLVGSPARDLRDAAGTPVTATILDVAKTKSEGAVEYAWLDRKTNRIEHKISLVKRVGDLVLGVGYYQP